MRDHCQTAVRRTAPLQICIAALSAIYVAAVLNAPVFVRRWSENVEPSMLLTELLLVLSVTFLIFLAGSLANRLVFGLFSLFMIGISSIGAYYIHFYDVVIGHGIVESVFTTEMDLISEIVDLKLYIWIFVLGCLPGVIVWRASRAHTSILRLLSSKGTAIVTILTFVASAALAIACVKILNVTDQRAAARGQDVPSSAALAAHRYLPSNWISGLGMWLSSAWQQNVEARNLSKPSEQYSWSVPPSLTDSVIVLVIGETARWDHMSILGYRRPTTPLLEKQEGLVAMRGESCDTSTALSLRCMFVRPEGMETQESGIAIQKEDNVFSIFNHLGFSIDLFAMQAEVGFYSKTYADHYKIREVISSEPYNARKPVDDTLLIREVQDSLARWESKNSGKPHLIILHTKGSHFSYIKRYPREFAAFTPECSGSNMNCTQSQLINAYDNSILYTDFFLSSLIDTLRNRKAFLFYVSDHGESIDDDLHLHGTPKELAPKEQFSVPFILWYSQNWLTDKQSSHRFEQLRKSSNETRKHTEIFDSLLGCAGIASPDGGIQPQRNWCNSKEAESSHAKQ